MVPDSEETTMIRRTAVTLLFVLLALPLLAADVLRNSDVIKMVKAGLSPATIEAKIRSSDTDFNLDTDSLIILSEAKVSDSVIRAMIESQEKGKPKAAAKKTARPSREIPMTDFDVYLETSNWNTCKGTLTIDEEGMRGTGCASRNLNFDVKWSEIESFCYEFAFYQTMYIKTAKRRYRVSATDSRSVSDVQKLLRKYREDIPELTKCQ
jgi:hypothetical protein